MQSTTIKLLISGILTVSALLCYTYVFYLKNDTLQPVSLSGLSLSGSSLMRSSEAHPDRHAELTVNSNDQQRQGHIMVYSSYEEQTNGARNLWQLHMWAAILKMRVVEPFAIESMFGIIGALSNFTRALRFSDYFDIDKWNKLVITYGGSSLVQWEDFLSKAPRKLIILYTLPRGLQHNTPLIVTYGENDVKAYNPTKYEHIPTEDMMWLKQNFNITRVVNFIRDGRVKHPLSMEELKSYVLGDIDPTEVTLLIVNWIGISITQMRIQVKDNTVYSSLTNAMHVDFRVPQGYPEVSPSQRVLKAYKTFVSKYIGNHKYVGIIFRTHCVLEYGVQGNFNQKVNICLVAVNN